MGLLHGLSKHGPKWVRISVISTTERSVVLSQNPRMFTCGCSSSSTVIWLAAQKPGRENKIIVVVGTVTDDLRIYKLPKITLCALRITARARARIEGAGGEVITFDQLARRCPTGKNTLLVQGRRNAREACKHFGRAPGLPHSHAKPLVRSKGRKFERARGRRSSKA